MLLLLHGIFAIMTYLAYLSVCPATTSVNIWKPIVFIDFPIFRIYVFVAAESSLFAKESGWESATILLFYLLTVGALYWYFIGWLLDKFIIAPKKPKTA